MHKNKKNNSLHARNLNLNIIYTSMYFQVLWLCAEKI